MPGIVWMLFQKDLGRQRNIHLQEGKSLADYTCYCFLMKDCTIEHHQCLSLFLNSKPKLHWAATACLLLIMQSTICMEASTIFQPASPVYMYCKVALTSYFSMSYVQFFFLLDQFMHVLISLGALTQPIMSISAQSDPHYVKWCCYTMLLMMSQQTHWPFMSFPSSSFFILWFSKSSQQFGNVRKKFVCCCTIHYPAIYCRELPSLCFWSFTSV